MLLVPAVKDTTVAVMGLGLSGLATCRALMASGARVWAWDDHEEKRGEAAGQGVPLIDLAGADWERVDRLILSPGIPLHHPKPHPLVRRARVAGVPIEGDVELMAISQPERTIVGITGTNGKSTTTALASHLLRVAGVGVQMGGNIGVPVLDLMPEPDDDVFVLELSSYQLDLTTSLACRVAVLLNLTPDHLDRHGSLEAYAAAKRRIFDHQRAGDVAIVGVDDRHGRELAASLRHSERRVLPISAERPLERGVFAEGTRLFDALDGTPQDVLDLSGLATLRGRHNVQNTAAAYAIARVLGVDAERAASGLGSFPGLAHRQEPVGTLDGVRFINDSKATNPASAARALASFDHIHWIAGGRPKRGGLDAVFPYLEGVRRAYLIGEAASQFAKELEGRVAAAQCGDLQEAVGQAFRNARREADAVVLLSPACASFDQFRSFEARGEAFKALVADLAGASRQTGTAAGAGR